MIQEKKRRGRSTKTVYVEPKKPTKKMPTKRVFICSPLKGDIQLNMMRARIYCRFAFDSGFVPIAPHIYFPQFLDDKDRDERAAGTRYGLELMWMCCQLWVFGCDITEGMRSEINLAKELKIPVKYFDSDMEELDG